MASMQEQETVVSQLRNAETLIYTANPVHLRRLRKESRAIETRGGEDWAEFIVAPGLFDPVRGFKRTKVLLSDEERARRAARLQKARTSLKPQSVTEN
jgi:hypothetical protein